MNALLFDLDGTLVDSIPTWVDANIRMLKEFGCQMDPETFLRDYYQKGLHFKGILEKCGVDPTRGKEFYPKRDALYIELLKDEAEWIDSADEVLQKCAEKMPLGLMTGSRRSFVDALDAQLKITDLFKVIITYEDTGKQMKPDPYGLLLLTKNLGVDPATCLYIGDQDVDVKAAHAAGMKCCIIPRYETPEGSANEADIVLRSIEDVVQIAEGGI